MTTLMTFLTLLRRDWSVFVPTLKDRIINGLSWFGFMVVVFEYIMPEAGLANYGLFTAISSIVSWGFFSVMNSAGEMIADLEGERSITYYLTLPLPQWMVFARIALSNAIQSIAISLLFIPMTKLFLWNQFDLASVAWGKFFLIFLLINLFYGFFSLFLASCIKTFATIENVWMRIVWPIWFLGCYQFKWSFLFKVSPALAYCNFINPMVFIMEGIRAAGLGQEDSLPYWWCFTALIVFTLFFGTLGIHRLKRRLDCI